MGGAAGMNQEPPCSGQGPEIQPSELPNGTVGVEYMQDLEAPGGPQDQLTWRIEFGELPPGIELSAETGMLSGTPTMSGAFTFELVVDVASTGECGIAPGFATLTLTIDEA